MRAILSQTVFRRARRLEAGGDDASEALVARGESWETPLAGVDAREGGS